MSKTVTIPTDGMNPFVVIFNGVKYVYTPGETVEVPDGVALEIEEYKRWREKHPGENVPPFGAQPDWEQNDPNAPDFVKNRPFYDNRDKIEYTFDGNLEGKETFNAGPAVFVKVSSSTPDIPSIQEIEATFVPVGEDGEVFEEETISISDFGQVAEDIFSTQDMAFAIVLKDTIFNGITITKGVYLSKGDNGSYISRVFFKFDTGELKKLDKKYLPDTDSFTVTFSDLLDAQPTYAKTINLELFRAVINAYKDWGRMPNVYINDWGSHYAHIIGVTSGDWGNAEEEYNFVIFKYFNINGAMSELVVYPSQLAYEDNL